MGTTKEAVGGILFSAVWVADCGGMSEIKAIEDFRRSRSSSRSGSWLCSHRKRAGSLPTHESIRGISDVIELRQGTDIQSDGGAAALIKVEA